MRNKILEKISTVLILSITFFIIYIPVIMIFIMSFTNHYSLSTLGLKNGLTMKWYASLFTNDYGALQIASKYTSNIKSLKTAILNTFGITILSTIISTFFGTLFSIGIHSFSKKMRASLMILNNMPVIMPDIVTGFLLLVIFVLFENIFNFERGFGTVLISHIYLSIPYVVLSVLPRLNQIDQNTYEAARDLGCTRFEAIFKAIIPSIMTGIVSGAMFAFTMSIDDFVITMFVSGQRFYNVSTWIDTSLRRGFIPKSVYAYNVIIFTIASVVVILSRTSNSKKLEKKIKI